MRGHRWKRGSYGRMCFVTRKDMMAIFSGFTERNVRNNLPPVIAGQKFSPLYFVRDVLCVYALSGPPENGGRFCRGLGRILALWRLGWSFAHRRLWLHTELRF